jgi:predicted RNA binding protein with dsRBD fold (UPF0201 family)
MKGINFATIDDTESIMGFIHNYWKEDHILSSNRELFLYEHQDNNRINFVIHKDANGSINGVLGFIKSSELNSDIWTVIWKAVSSKNHPMLGVELFDFLRNSKEYGVLLSLGINTKTIGIYDYLDIYTNNLNHYVILNKNIKDFKIARLLNGKYLKEVNFLFNKKYSLELLEESKLDFAFEAYKRNIPYKSRQYFIKRYFHHSIYKYKVFGIYKNNKLTSLMVARVVTVNESQALRIVDYIGEDKDIQFVSKYLHKLIVDNKFEYVDFMCFGFDNNALQQAGFTKVNPNSKSLIIPNYFSPFVQENVVINFFADTKDIDNIKIYKADGDQDRPS